MTVSRNTVILGGYIAVYVLTVLLATVVDHQGGLTIAIGMTWSAFVLGRLLVGGIDRPDVAFVVLLAAFQNVVLGLFAPALSAFAVRLLISTNVLLPLLWLVAMWLTAPETWVWRRTLAANGIILAAVGLLAVSVGLFGLNGVAGLASVRNITSPIIFFAVGYFVALRRPESPFLWRVVLRVGVVVVLAGIAEQMLLSDLWPTLHVRELWEKKGLTNVGLAGVPTNWYSAERFGGEQVRRMVSTFADPVNLGTFLFLVFMTAYLLRRWIVAALAFVGIVFTVSKGALVGLLGLACIWAYYQKSRPVFALTLTSTAVLGAAFVWYSLRYATGSLLLHLAGATNAVVQLHAHPLGRGLGRAGTLAQQFVFLGKQDILESGVGLVIGQLGMPGLLLYVGFFGLVLRWCRACFPVRTRIYAVALLAGIVTNIAFNEVALSPNSSAAYFLILGELAFQGRMSTSTRGGRAGPAGQRISG